MVSLGIRGPARPKRPLAHSLEHERVGAPGLCRHPGSRWPRGLFPLYPHVPTPLFVAPCATCVRRAPGTERGATTSRASAPWCRRAILPRPSNNYFFRAHNTASKWSANGMVLRMASRHADSVCRPAWPTELHIMSPAAPRRVVRTCEALLSTSARSCLSRMSTDVLAYPTPAIAPSSHFALVSLTSTSTLTLRNGTRSSLSAAAPKILCVQVRHMPYRRPIAPQREHLQRVRHVERHSRDPAHGIALCFSH